MEEGFAFFKQPQVMRSAFANSDTEDGSFGSTNQLDFLCVSFLFPAVVAPLFFFGRSSGLSPTSTRMILPSTLPSIFNSAFLPGRPNTPLFTRVSSILRTIRQPCDSL